MNTAVKIGEKYSYGDYLKWPDGERWELIDGSPCGMSPAPTKTHQKCLGVIFRMIADFLDDKPCEVYPAPFDVRLPEGDEADDNIETVVQPDIVVVCDKSKLDEAGCRGAPDLIIEILSESTAGKDLNEKFFLYERHAVKEYWAVNVWDMTLSQYYLGANKKYGTPTLAGLGDKTCSKVLKGLEIEISKIFKNLKRVVSATPKNKRRI